MSNTWNDSTVSGVSSWLREYGNNDTVEFSTTQSHSNPSYTEPSHGGPYHNDVTRPSQLRSMVHSDAHDCFQGKRQMGEEPPNRPEDESGQKSANKEDVRNTTGPDFKRAAIMLSEKLGVTVTENQMREMYAEVMNIPQNPVRLHLTGNEVVLQELNETKCQP